MPIRSFADKITLALFEGRTPKGVGATIADRAHIRLSQLDAAQSLQELASPGADLKQLVGEKHGWQMRVNKQFRIRFNINGENPLEIADVWFGDPH